MAYGTLANYGSNVGIVNVYAPSYEEILYKNNDLFATNLFEKQTSNGDSAFRWKMHATGNTSAGVFSEGDGAPTPVAQAYVNCAVNYVYFWAWVRVSGHARDAARGAGIHPGMSPLDLEMVLGMEDIVDVMNTTFMGATNSGLEVSIDGGTAYAGITRASYAGFCSTETALSGNLTRTHMMDMIETARDNDKGSRIGKGGNGAILMPENQLTNYLRLTGEPSTQYGSLVTEMALVKNGGFDIAPSRSNASFQGIPIYSLGDMLDTVVLYVDTRPGKNLFVEHRAFDVRGPQMVGDDDVYELSCACAIINKNPRFDAKSTGVTA